MMNDIYDVLVVGAGPAGLTAALYAGRAGKSVIVFEKEVFGGQITYSPKVENYPGIPEVSGNEFAETLLSQISALGVSVRFGSVSSIRIADGDGVHDKIVTVSGKEYSARTVIIASGSRHRPLGVEREEELVGAGVSYCAVCDGAFFAGRDVCVAGGGNTALQDAIYLSARSSKVYLIHRREQFRGDAALVDKIRNTENIEIVTPAVIERLGGEHALESVTVKYTDGREREIPAQGLFIAVGQIPQNAPFEGIQDTFRSARSFRSATEYSSRGTAAARSCVNLPRRSVTARRRRQRRASISTDFDRAAAWHLRRCLPRVIGGVRRAACSRCKKRIKPVRLHSADAKRTRPQAHSTVDGFRPFGVILAYLCVCIGIAAIIG